MIQINLLKEPNQSFKFQVGGELYDIAIRTTRDATFISIGRDGVELFNSHILIPNQSIRRYNYLVTGGNFVLSTQNNNLPDYTKFGDSQFLYYLTLDELP